MPNEMMRPCQPEGWGLADPFDAIGATVLPSCRDLKVYTKDGRVIRFEFATREALEIGYMDTITTIADALNAPVLATEEVLDAMAEVPEAKFSLVLDDKPWATPETRRRTTTLYFNGHPENVCWYGHPNDNLNNMVRIGFVKDEDGDYIDSGYIQADCPLALQVLLGFTTEGVPANE
jgi:hypothetical protein